VGLVASGSDLHPSGCGCCAALDRGRRSGTRFARGYWIAPLRGERGGEWPQRGWNVLRLVAAIPKGAVVKFAYKNGLTVGAAFCRVAGPARLMFAGPVEEREQCRRFPCTASRRACFVCP